MLILTRAIQLLGLLALAACVVSCSWVGLLPPATDEASAAPQSSGGSRFPDVLAVEVRPLGGRNFDLAVTLSSAYDTPQRYADGWRVLDPAGNVLGTHTLLHDHASEQPFTRTQRSVHIPDGVEEITVEGRDQGNGFGGLAVTVKVPAS